MKILCLIDTLGPGGAERQMMILASLLKQNGFDIDLVAYTNHTYNSILEKEYGISSITLEGTTNKIGKLFSVRRLIKRNKYEVVIAYKDGASMIACLLKSLNMKFKLIASERNTTQALTLKEKIKFSLFKRADFIVPNSISQEQFIKSNFKKLTDKTIAITNYTDTSFFYPIKKNCNFPLKILTVGRIAPQKNFINYIYAINEIKKRGYKALFFWYGNPQKGEENYTKLCFETIENLSISDYLQVFPATPNIRDVYYDSDIFCLPSLYEGYPNVLCEAMSCGMPIMCSRVCDNPLIIKNGECGMMFNPSDVNDIVEKMEVFLNLSPDELQEYGRKSRLIAIANFSKDSFVAKYIDLINKAIS